MIASLVGAVFVGVVYLLLRVAIDNVRQRIDALGYDVDADTGALTRRPVSEPAPSDRQMDKWGW